MYSDFKQIKQKEIEFRKELEQLQERIAILRQANTFLYQSIPIQQLE